MYGLERVLDVCVPLAQVCDVLEVFSLERWSCHSCGWRLEEMVIVGVLFLVHLCKKLPAE